ncbi:MAG TPA: DUF2934 domain-containing protein [Bryobacteraceae bacterium]|nr:DUF2934 domain-containing protein [Bryobacteraceae bacterium]
MATKRVSEKEIVVSPATPLRHQPATTRRIRPSVTPARPTHEDIALLAHSYWEARGCEGGSAEEDWLRAERELTHSAAI